MEVKVYRIKGRFLMGERMQTFTKEYRAISERNAIEKAYSDFGSKHKVKRNRIKIEEVKETAPEE
jgi:large subunit ribosomal protein LX